MNRAPSPIRDEEAQARAIGAIQGVRPRWSGVRRLADVSQGPAMRVYHAGPPYRSAQAIPRPVLNSMAHAALYEHWATDFDEALDLVLSGAVQTLACQDANLLVPLAGVLSPSMAVLEISASAGGLEPIYVAINEGQLHATRLGRRDEDLVAHLQWLNGSFADWLAGCLMPSLALLPIIERALDLGDDCHARTVEGSALLRSLLLNADHPEDRKARDFLDQSPAFALNLWMGAAALCLQAAEGICGAGLVTRAGGNGVEFGIQLASNPGVWVCAPAPVPQGRIEADHVSRHAVGALGDSAVVDFLGLGGQALMYAPLVFQGLQVALPHDAMQRGSAVLQTAPTHPARLNAVSARHCAASRLGPLVLLGMIDRSGIAGRIGGGYVQVPGSLFERALKAACEMDVRDAA